MGHATSNDSRQSSRLRHLEGHRVSLVLTDGSTFDDVTLVSSGRGGVSSLWLEVGGMDVLVHCSQVLEAWELGFRTAA